MKWLRRRVEAASREIMATLDRSALLSAEGANATAPAALAGWDAPEGAPPTAEGARPPQVGEVAMLRFNDLAGVQNLALWPPPNGGINWPKGWIVRSWRDVVVIGPLGSRNDLLMVNLPTGRVRAGCFKHSQGTITEFVLAVHQSHAGTPFEVEYVLALETVQALIALRADEMVQRAGEAAKLDTTEPATPTAEPEPAWLAAHPDPPPGATLHIHDIPAAMLDRSAMAAQARSSAASLAAGVGAGASASPAAGWVMGAGDHGSAGWETLQDAADAADNTGAIS